MKINETDLFIGTSGWSYPHWKGNFYPHDWPQSRWFDYYITKFQTVEVNATFYRFSQDQTYEKWYKRAPDNFHYVLKAPRLITHRKYLIDVEEQIHAFWTSASLLKEKFGLILLQLPPNTPYDPDRLNEALLSFGDPRRIAVEFRHKKWLTEETKTLLHEIGSIFCNADSPKTELTDWLTSDIAYIRLHGRESWYGYEYSARELKNIVELMQRMVRAGAKQIYVYFNNDLAGFAPKNARRLIELVKH